MNSPRDHFTTLGSPNPSVREVPTRPQSGPVLPVWGSPARSPADTSFALPDWAKQVTQSPPDKLITSHSSLASLGSPRSLQGHVPEKSRKSRNVAVQAQVGSLDDDLQKLRESLDSQHEKGLDRLGQHLDQRIDILVGGVENHVQDTVERMRVDQNERFGQVLKQACVDASEAARKEASNVVETMASSMKEKLEETTMMVVAAEQRMRTVTESQRQTNSVDQGVLENSVIETCVRQLSSHFQDELKMCRDECSALRASISHVEHHFGEALATMEFKVAQDVAMLRDSSDNGLRAEIDEVIALRAMLRESGEDTLRRDLEQERTERKEQGAALRACFEATYSALNTDETTRMSEGIEKADALAKQAAANAMDLVEDRLNSRLEDQRRQLSQEVEALGSLVDTLSKQLGSEISTLVTGLETIRIDIQSLQAFSRTQTGCTEENAWNITKFSEQLDALRSELTESSCAQLALRADVTTLQSKIAAGGKALVREEDEDSLMMKAQAAVAAATSQLMKAIESERSQRLAQAELFSERLEASRSDVHRVLEEELVKQREVVTVEQQRALERCAPLEVTRDLNEALGSLRKAFAEELEKNDQLRAEIGHNQPQSGSLRDGSEAPEKSAETNVMVKVDSAVTDRLSKVETDLVSVQMEVERMISKAMAEDGTQQEGLHVAWLESGLSRLRATLTGELDVRFNEELNALRIEATKDLQSRILAVEAKITDALEVGQLRQEAIHLLEPQIVENARRLEDIRFGTDKKIESLSNTLQNQISQIIDLNAANAFKIAEMQQQHGSLDHSVKDAPRRESSQMAETLLPQHSESTPSQAVDQSAEEINNSQSHGPNLEDSLRNLISKVDKKLRNTEESLPHSQSLKQDTECAPSPGLKPWDNVMSPGAAAGVDTMGISWSSVPRQAMPTSTSATQTDTPTKEEKQDPPDLALQLTPNTRLRDMPPLPSAATSTTHAQSVSSFFAHSSRGPSVGGVSPRIIEAPKDQESFMKAIETLREENSWLRERNCEISDRLGKVDQSGQEGIRVGAVVRGVSPPGFKPPERQNIDAKEMLSNTWAGVPKRAAAPAPQTPRSAADQRSAQLHPTKQSTSMAQRMGVTTTLGGTRSSPSGPLQTSLRQAAQAKAAANRARSPPNAVPAQLSPRVQPTLGPANQFAMRSARR